MNSFVKIGILLTGLFFLSSCATIMKGSSQEMNVKSTPADAKLVVKSTAGIVVYEGVTPAKFKLSKAKEYNVTISLDGYKDQTVFIGAGAIEGAFWANICIGGIIGVVIDLSSGAWKKLEPNTINVNLVTASLDGKSEGLYAVFTAKDSKGELRQVLVPMIKS